LDLYYAADDKVAYFGSVAGAKGNDGEKFVSLEDGAEDGAADCGR
jgi:hypothetical protein